MSSQIRIVLLAILLASNVDAETQEVDITEHLVKLMTCSAEHYQPTEQSFDIIKFNDSWEQCGYVREALLNALPEANRPEWAAKLEKIRSSMIDRFQPQPSRPGYGLSPSDPVKIGGIENGPARTYAYFSRLRDQAGKTVQVKRIGSCCRFKTPNAVIGDHAALDKYELSMDQFKSKITVYVNIYDHGEIHAIEGFTLHDDG